MYKIIPLTDCEHEQLALSIRIVDRTLWRLVPVTYNECRPRVRTIPHLRPVIKKLDTFRTHIDNLWNEEKPRRERRIASDGLPYIFFPESPYYRGRSNDLNFHAPEAALYVSRAHELFKAAFAELCHGRIAARTWDIGHDCEIKLHLLIENVERKLAGVSFRIDDNLN